MLFGLAGQKARRRSLRAILKANPHRDIYDNFATSRPSFVRVQTEPSFAPGNPDLVLEGHKITVGTRPRLRHLSRRQALPGDQGTCGRNCAHGAHPRAELVPGARALGPHRALDSVHRNCAREELRVSCEKKCHFVLDSFWEAIRKKVRARSVVRLCAR